MPIGTSVRFICNQWFIFSILWSNTTQNRHWNVKTARQRVIECLDAAESEIVDMIEMIERAQALRQAKSDELAAKVERGWKKKVAEKAADLRSSKAEAWEVAKLDNETLLERWEVLKEECHIHGEKLLLKPHVTTRAGVWALVCGEEQGESAEESFLDDLEPSECSSNEDDGEDDDNS
ncbi:uncharacterized protein EI90DRAFT_3023780 [Cantharellus anzutake]|uniref:uncharacterized protein n=1 Tax=Cantharellus anzutake TaxID=1750568 RepID=UPI0019036638|nr:uncharacterized protein EI90DRAFT_3023780 [Cantharellus anzutake]KAF8311321.1 hypothetical protein EI90DRAFT_3023780 [Cantharellus anzutake]